MPPTSVSIRGTSPRSSPEAHKSRAGCTPRKTWRNGKSTSKSPRKTTYKNIEVYKLTHWVQGPVLNQTLNILEGIDVKSMGYNSNRYIHALYQAMNLAFADRDSYYGDPYFAP
jgi:gamma-glutamyltranspeptidase/glutathione hydrolase